MNGHLQLLPSWFSAVIVLTPFPGNYSSDALFMRVKRPSFVEISTRRLKIKPLTIQGE
jgi:hypothetical protein